MQSGLENSPRVSFIMPTLNAGALLDNCLASIVRQTYPRSRYEIILADAHSKDRTREIAGKYGARVLDDNGKNMEEGKRLALQHATGEYIVFVDADNEITHADYIELAIKALAANPAGTGRGKLLFAFAENEFVLRLPHAPAAHQRPDLLADEHKSNAGRAPR